MRASGMSTGRAKPVRLAFRMVASVFRRQSSGPGNWVSRRRVSRRSGILASGVGPRGSAKSSGDAGGVPLIGG